MPGSGQLGVGQPGVMELGSSEGGTSGKLRGIAQVIFRTTAELVGSLPFVTRLPSFLTLQSPATRVTVAGQSAASLGTLSTSAALASVNTAAPLRESPTQVALSANDE